MMRASLSFPYVMEQQYCGYCQRFRSGVFRLTSNLGLTRICESCYPLRRKQSKPSAPDLSSVNNLQRPLASRRSAFASGPLR
jgi:hypothetical protein